MRYDEGGNRLRLARLSDRGVKIWGAEQVWIAEDVRLERIEPGAEIYQAALSGSDLFIGRGARIGISGPARISDCQIGRDCEIGAGTYDGATFLDGAKVRGFAEVRPGTLLEEQTEAAHSVAFKNTILTATCVTGSLINFCDLFMSGGTSREEHSEVGSGAIHFNFDPRGDKWGSAIGDAKGVLLRRPPIFVGGHVGLVGPLSINFGAVIAAGSIVRKSVPSDCIYSETGSPGVTVREGFRRENYGSVRRKILTTAKLAGTYVALWNWYSQVRIPAATEHEEVTYAAALLQIERNINERAKRIEKLIAKLPPPSDSAGVGNGVDAEHQLLRQRREQVMRILKPEDIAGPPAPSALPTTYRAMRASNGHVDAVRGLPSEIVGASEEWLEQILQRTTGSMETLLGS